MFYGTRVIWLLRNKLKAYTKIKITSTVSYDYNYMPYCTKSLEYRPNEAQCFFPAVNVVTESTEFKIKASCELTERI